MKRRTGEDELTKQGKGSQPEVNENSEKRARHDGSEPPRPSLTYAQFKSLVLRREEVARWCNSPVFDKLVRGRYVRCSLNGPPRIYRVLGAGDPSSEVNPIEFAAGPGDSTYSSWGRLSIPPPHYQAAKGGKGPATMIVHTGSRLRLFDPLAGKEVPSHIPLAVVSNSLASEDEWRGVESFLPCREELDKLLESWERIVSGQVAGKMACVWGGGSVPGEESSIGRARIWGHQPPLNTLNRTLQVLSSSPTHPPVRLAIIVPYRDTDPRQGRARQLARFAAYMPTFLRGAECSPSPQFFTILIVEQSDDGYKFNRGKLLNVGSLLLSTREGRQSLGLSGDALELGFNAFCLHDVDLLPQPPLAPWYAASPALSPIHIGGAWKHYDYVSYVGGILTLSWEALQATNGFPNDFWGWGGEDDEIQRRLMRTNNYPTISPGRELLKYPPLVLDLEEEAAKTVEGSVRAGLKVKSGGVRAWRNMLKDEALEAQGDRWASNGLNSCSYKLLLARAYYGESATRDDTGSSPVVFVATVDLLPQEDVTAQRSLMGAREEDVLAEEERLRLVLSGITAANGKKHWGNATGENKNKLWKEGIKQEFLRYASMDWGEGEKAAYLKLLPPSSVALRGALIEASATLCGGGQQPSNSYQTSTASASPSRAPTPYPSVCFSSIHRVWIVLRSWIVQDVNSSASSVEDNIRDASTHATSGVMMGWAGDVNGETPDSIPDMLKKSLAAGPAFDRNGFGKGPMGVAQRVVGSYHYLFQCRGVSGRGSSGSLAPIVSVAHPTYDEGNPEITAWRALRKYVDDDIPLSLFRASVLAQVDVSATSSSSPNPHDGPQQQQFISPSGHPTTVLRGPLQLFIVNADTIARCRGLKGVPLDSPSLAITQRPPPPPTEQLGYHTFYRDFEARVWISSQLGSAVLMPASRNSTTAAPPASCIPQPPSMAPRIAELFRIHLRQLHQKQPGKEEEKYPRVVGSGGHAVECTDNIGGGEAGEWGVSSLLLSSHHPSGCVWLSERDLESNVCAPTLPPSGGEKSSADLIPQPFSPSPPLSRASEIPPHFSPAFLRLYESVVFVFSRLASHPRLHRKTPGALGSVLDIEELCAILKSAHVQANSGKILPSHPWLPQLFPRRTGYHLAHAFHGTSIPSAQSILGEGGFRRSACRYLTACAAGSCDDQMLGFGVYIGGRKKAETFAVRNSLQDSVTGVSMGALISCCADVGHLKVAAGPCKCGACGGKECCDHFGDFYALEGFDTLMVDGGKAAATSTAEWSVADPKRVVVVKYEKINAV